MKLLIWMPSRRTKVAISVLKRFANGSETALLKCYRAETERDASTRLFSISGDAGESL
jgi:hypothetical protein